MSRRLIRGMISFHLVLLFSLPVYGSKIASGDVWKNIVSGRYLGWFHSFPHPSVFVTAPVKNHAAGVRYDWLGSYSLYLLQESTNWIVLNGLKIIPVLLLTGCLLMILDDRRGIICGVSGTILTYGMGFRLIPRASIFGFVMFPILLLLVSKFQYQDKTTWIWFLAPLLVIWSNLHGSYVVGLVVLISYTTGYAVNYFGTSTVNFPARKFWILASLVILVFCALIFVGPFPETGHVEKGLDRLNTFLESPQSPSDGFNGFPTLKDLTQGILQGGKSYVSPENSYSLEKLYTTADYVVFFLVVPLSISYLVFNFRLELLPVLFVLGSLGWIGLGVQRGLIYFGLAASVLLLADYTHRSEDPLSFLRLTDALTWNFKTAGIAVLILLYIVILPGVTSGYDQMEVPKLQMYWELGWGRHSAWATDVPNQLLRNYPEDKVFNQLQFGPILLYEWWPWKKVFWWSKTSDLRESILRKRQQGQIDLKYFQKRGITLSVMPTRYAKQPNPYERLPGWCRVATDEFMTAYRKCP